MFLKAYQNSIHIEIKYLVSHEIIFSSKFCSAENLLGFGKSVEAAKHSEMDHGKVLCFNPHHLVGVDGTAELLNDDYEKLPVCCGTLSWHLKIYRTCTGRFYTSGDSAFFCKIALPEIL